MNSLKTKKKTSKLFKISNLFLFSFTLSLLFFSCEKENSIGYDLLSENEKITILDTTIDISVSTIRETEITTDERSLSLLGFYKDDVFGSSKADIITELRLSSSQVVFEENAVADSLVLQMKYSDYYGTGSINFSIYRLEEPIYDTLDYYSNSVVAFDSLNPLYSGSFTPSENDTLRFQLGLDLANEFLNADTADLDDNETFKEFFPGLVIVAEETSDEGAICYFDLTNDTSELTLYYREDTDTNTFSFVINDYNARFNQFTHNIENTPLEEAINNNSTDKIYIQAMAGAKAYFEFDSALLKSIVGDSLSMIVKADLIFNIDSNYSFYNLPSRLITELRDTVDGFDAPEDYYHDVNVSSTYYDAYLDSTDFKYSINLSQYVQGIIDDTQENLPLMVFPVNDKVVADRVVIDNSEGNRIRCRIRYSKF